MFAPVCGEKSATKTEKREIIDEPLGGQKTILLNEYSCGACGASGDFYDENEALIKNSLSELKRTAVNNILETFVKNKISLSAIERALELPQRTLSKWKNGVTNPSASGTALMKFLWLYPWLLEVAENRYDYAKAQRIHISSALGEVMAHLNSDEDVFSHTELGPVSGRGFLFFQFGGSNSPIQQDAELYSEPSFTLHIENTNSGL